MTLHVLIISAFGNKTIICQLTNRILKYEQVNLITVNLKVPIIIGIGSYDVLEYFSHITVVTESRKALY